MCVCCDVMKTRKEKNQLSYVIESDSVSGIGPDNDDDDVEDPRGCGRSTRRGEEDCRRSRSKKTAT